MLLLMSYYNVIVISWQILEIMVLIALCTKCEMCMGSYLVELKVLFYLLLKFVHARREGSGKTESNCDICNKYQNLVL